MRGQGEWGDSKKASVAGGLGEGAEVGRELRMLEK